MDIKAIITEELKMLNEAVSDIVYHYTYTPNLLGILKTNKFVASTNIGSTADALKDKGRSFFFSTQRTKGKSGYAKNHGTDIGIVLDGRKLNQNYKGFPTDYWNWSKKRSDYDSDSNYREALQSSELEDRIVTNKPYIDDASRYILEIHVLVKTDNSYVDKTILHKIQSLATQHNLPIYFYTNINDFALQNKSKAIPLDSINIPDKLNTYDEGNRSMMYNFAEIASLILLNDNNKNQEKIFNLLKLTLEKENRPEAYKTFYNEIRDKIKDLSRSWNTSYQDDIYRSTSATIHNHRGNPNPEFRQLLKYLGDDMRYIGTNNLKSYINKKLIPN